MYAICRLHADRSMLDEHDVPVWEYHPPLEHSLALIEINLQRFRDGEISDAALENICNVFRHFAAIKVEMIVRFVYDWEGQGAMYEPQRLSIILNHMEQLSDILKEYGAHIYILQGLFIGSWGEMHNTRYNSQTELITLARKLAECSSPHTFIAVRCPNLWRSIFRTYSTPSYADIQRGSLQSRFCLFNDAIMSSDTDMGTYGSVSRSVSLSCTDKLCRYDEITFQGQLCRYVPNGGEVLHASPLNDIKTALRTMEMMRLSYLNSNYDRTVLNKWRNGAHQTGAFRKASDLDFISAHLGYRYHLMRSEVSCIPGETSVRAKLTLINRGFAACHRPLNVSLVLCSTEGNEEWAYPLDTDVRTWQPGKAVELEAVFAPPASGICCIVGLRLQCPLTKKMIRLANSPDPIRNVLINPIGELIL